MPAIVIQIGEKVELLELKRARFNSQGQTAWLFVNDHMPGAYDTLANYSPTAVQGVGGQPLGWPAPAYDGGDGNAYMVGAYIAFQPTGILIVETVYGYYVTDNTTGLFVYAQRLAAPIANFGATLIPIVFSPRFKEVDAPA